MTTIIKFVRYHEGVADSYACDWPANATGEYVPLAEYQALEVQYRELGDSSNDAIQSLVKQRSKLQSLIQRVNEMDLGTDCDRYENLLQSNELEQLLADCKEAVE